MHPLARTCAGAALAILMGLTASAAAAADAAQHEAARLALRDGQYQRVVALTREIAKTEPGAALNWYRMAIAAQRIGDPQGADTALRRAIEADPRMSFASTPQRVERLRGDISNDLRKAAEAQAAIAKDSPASETDPGATAARTDAHADLVIVQQKMEAGLDALAKKLAEQSRADREAYRSDNSWGSVAALLLVAFAGAVVATLIANRRTMWRSKRDMRDLAELPLQDLIAAARDVHAVLIQRMEMHQHVDSELYQHLQRSLPSLERESGRARVRLNDLTTGSAFVDVQHDLRPRPPILGHQDPSSLHRTVLKRALENTAPAMETS